MITVQNITKKLGNHPVVSDVSFTVPDGSITGFVGPNGAGKSTTMRMMLGLTSADAGTARFDGVSYRDLPVPFRQVGSMLDARVLFPNLRARDVVEYCARSQGIQPRTKELLDLVGLTGAESKRVAHLSLGMRQRLGIAVALVASPNHLVLDEPLNGLDPSGIAWMRDILRQLRSEGCAILLSSHIISELAIIADDIVVITEGHVVLSGPLTDLAKQGHQHVLARTDHPNVLLTVIEDYQGKGHHSPGDPVTITGLSAPEVFQLAARHGITLDELTTSSRSLDDIYRDAISNTTFQEVS